MTFNIPDKYSPPEGIKEGEIFKDIASFKFVKGKIVLVAIGQKNVPISGKPKSAKQAMNEALKENVDYATLQ